MSAVVTFPEVVEVVDGQKCIRKSYQYEWSDEGTGNPPARPELPQRVIDESGSRDPFDDPFFRDPWCPPPHARLTLVEPTPCVLCSLNERRARVSTYRRSFRYRSNTWHRA